MLQRLQNAADVITENTTHSDVFLLEWIEQIIKMEPDDNFLQEVKDRLDVISDILEGLSKLA